MSKEFEFKVNGDQFVSDKQKLTAIEILEIAREKGSIPGPPQDYILKGTKQDYKGTDLVDLSQDDIFITVPTTATQVA